MNKHPFVPNKIYNRRADIHQKYGGNWQGGICPCRDFPFIFIFTGKTGHQYGYSDGWDNENIFSYTGEGQLGNMSFIKGNLALKDHIKNNKQVFLFEKEKTKGFVKFICEVEVVDVDYFEAPDKLGGQRTAIKFFFKKLGVVLPKYIEQLGSINKVSDSLPEYKIPDKTERQGLVTSRVGQGAYRKRIIHRWESKCAVTGFDRLDILIASHIVPWKEATHAERLDVDNGILLSPIYDGLFDKHLITFENSGKIILSDKLNLSDYSKIGVTGKEQINKFLESNFSYLERHRKRFNENH